MYDADGTLAEPEERAYNYHDTSFRFRMGPCRLAGPSVVSRP